MKFRIKRCVQRNRTTESSLFKIPETCNGEVLTCTRMPEEDAYFKLRVEKHSLAGLIFMASGLRGKELSAPEKPAVPTRKVVECDFEGGP